MSKNEYLKQLKNKNNKIITIQETNVVKENKIATKIIENMKNKPSFVFIKPKLNQENCSYSFFTDCIKMPKISYWKKGYIGYYEVFFHEIAHSTMSKTRTNRIKEINHEEQNDIMCEEIIANIVGRVFAYICGERTDYKNVYHVLFATKKRNNLEKNIMKKAIESVRCILNK